MEHFNQLRQNGEFVDFIIMAGDQKFGVHKTVLASRSEYFRALLKSDLKEVTEGRVIFNDLNANTIESVIEFLYTGKVDVTNANLPEILDAAVRLGIRELEDFSYTLFEQRLDETNCLALYAIVFTRRVIFNKFLEYVRATCCRHFTEVVKQPEFLELDADMLADLISSDQLTVASEMEVLDAIEKWIKHGSDRRSSHAAMLLGNVRVAFMDVASLGKAADLDFVRDSPDCLRILLNATVHYLQNLLDEVGSTSQVITRPRNHRWLNASIFILGGATHTNDLEEPVHWFPETRNLKYVVETHEVNEATEINDLPTERYNFGAVILKEYIYVIGGHGGSIHYSSSHRYNLATSIWQRDIADLPQPVFGHRVVALNDHIYVIGGQTGNHLSSLIQKYDPDTDKWEICAPLPEDRTCFGAAAFEGKIYVAGGCVHPVDGRSQLDGIGEPTASAFVYDSETDEWSKLTPMQHARIHFGLCVCDGRIYAVSGNSGRISSAEYYEPAENRWHFTASMDRKLGVTEIVEYRGRIIAIDSKLQYEDGDDYNHEFIGLFNSASTYNPKTKTWTDLEMRHKYGQARRGFSLIVGPSS